MPVAASKSNAVPPRRTRTARATMKPLFQEALPATAPAPPSPPTLMPAPSSPAPSSKVDSSTDRPQEHKGIPAVREELVSNLPNAPYKISKLHLADGSVVSACRSCQFTADTRAEVAEHRNAEHGAKFGKGRRNVTLPIEKAPDLVLSPREDGSRSPSNPLDWTMRELLALMPSIGAFADLSERAERERDAAVAQLQNYMHAKPKLDNYDALSDEVVDLRLKIRNTGSYEKLEAEVTELRAFKKKIIARLSALGFNFTEEE